MTNKILFLLIGLLVGFIIGYNQFNWKEVYVAGILASPMKNNKVKEGHEYIIKYTATGDFEIFEFKPIYHVTDYFKVWVEK